MEKPRYVKFKHANRAFKSFNTAIENILSKEVDIAIYSINELII
ncbi:MAG: hypothetical protein ABFD07_01040 [Methanobacterium sp.]